MDWLENFFPFLRDLDAGDGALEVALVLLVIVIVVAIAVVARRRTAERPHRAGPTR